jgi:hypothetical protein
VVDLERHSIVWPSLASVADAIMEANDFSPEGSPLRSVVVLHRSVGCESNSSIEKQRLSRLLAERVGFEPTVRFPAHTLSKRAP